MVGKNAKGQIFRFNTQPPEGGWCLLTHHYQFWLLFQHTAARRRLVFIMRDFFKILWFQHTAARRRLAGLKALFDSFLNVSTHSRPKAAGKHKILTSITVNQFQHTAARRRLDLMYDGYNENRMFQHTAARRRLELITAIASSDTIVSTHSRPKAAGLFLPIPQQLSLVSTHSRPKAAGHADRQHVQKLLFQHTAARRRLGFVTYTGYSVGLFQHTAARRRLDKIPSSAFSATSVSTHSRPKAAGPARHWLRAGVYRFNTQPPEGGWTPTNSAAITRAGFNTQPPEGGWFIFA